jgi:hypothetical protein
MLSSHDHTRRKWSNPCSTLKWRAHRARKARHAGGSTAAHRDDKTEDDALGTITITREVLPDVMSRVVVSQLSSWKQVLNHECDHVHVTVSYKRQKQKIFFIHFCISHLSFYNIIRTQPPLRVLLTIQVSITIRFIRAVIVTCDLINNVIYWSDLYNVYVGLN